MTETERESERDRKRSETEIHGTWTNNEQERNEAQGSCEVRQEELSYG